jgi:hypothetical protein
MTEAQHLWATGITMELAAVIVLLALIYLVKS